MARKKSHSITYDENTGESVMHYDIVIIGAGPGGIFSAYELTRQDALG